MQTDLAHLAADKPVIAHGSDIPYRLGCWMRRWRWPALAAAVILLLIAAGFATTEWQARRAIAQAQHAETIQHFLLSLFRANTPTVTGGKEITAKDLLARGSARVDADLHDQPGADAELHSELGDIYNEIGDNQAALDHAQQVLHRMTQ